jgi:hypothetical protein
MSPLRVAAILANLSETAIGNLADADAKARNRTAPAFRRIAIDVSIQAALGQFFAAKLRAGVAYSMWQASHEPGWLRLAVDEYTAAHAAWCRAAEHGHAYRNDITVGGEPFLRGHWSDRLPAIDEDLADMRAELAAVSVTDVRALEPLEAPPAPVHVRHEPPDTFVPGAPVRVEVTVDGRIADSQIALHYRHVNQAEPYECAPMRETHSSHFAADIPAAYTDSPFPLQYFVILKQGLHAWRAPDLDADLANQPYWVVRQVPRARVATTGALGTESRQTDQI